MVNLTAYLTRAFVVNAHHRAGRAMQANARRTAALVHDQEHPLYRLRHAVHAAKYQAFRLSGELTHGIPTRAGF